MWGCVLASVFLQRLRFREVDGPFLRVMDVLTVLESDPVVQEKWFSTRGSFAPRGHSCLGAFSVVTTGQRGPGVGVGVLLASSGRDHDVAKHRSAWSRNTE